MPERCHQPQMHTCRAYLRCDLMGDLRIGCAWGGRGLCMALEHDDILLDARRRHGLHGRLGRHGEGSRPDDGGDGQVRPVRQVLHAEVGGGSGSGLHRHRQAAPLPRAVHGLHHSTKTDTRPALVVRPRTSAAASRWPWPVHRSAYGPGPAPTRPAGRRNEETVLRRRSHRVGTSMAPPPLFTPEVSSRA